MDNIIKNEKSALTESTHYININGIQKTHIRHTNDTYYVDYSIVGKNSKDKGYKNIPNELKQNNAWIRYNLIDQGREKPSKIPYWPNKQYWAKVNNSDTWGRYNTVISSIDTQYKLPVWMRINPDTKKWDFNNPEYIKYIYKKFDGIGYVFSEGDIFVGIDYDNWFDKNGNINDKCKEILSLCNNSYTELSQSEKGGHTIVKLSSVEEKIKLSKELNKRYGNPTGVRNDDIGIECYFTGRYFVMTGNVIENYTEIKEVDVDTVLSLFKGIRKETKPKTQNLAPRTDLNLDDQEILDLCKKAKNSDKIFDLYNQVGKDGNSEGDLSLISLFCFYTQDEEQIKRLMKNSPRYREKFDRPDDRLGKDIRKAIANRSENYNPEEYYKHQSNSNVTKFKKTNINDKTIFDILDEINKFKGEKILEAGIDFSKSCNYLDIPKTWGTGYYLNKHGFVKRSIIKIEDPAAQNKTKKEVYNDKLITPVLLVPLSLLHVDNNEELELKGFVGNEEKEIITENDTFSTVAKFKTFLGTYFKVNGWYDGNNDDLTGYQKYFGTYKKYVNLKAIKGVSCVGMHYHNNEWVYVSKNGAFNKNNKSVNDIRVLAKNVSINDSKLLNTESLNNNDKHKLEELKYIFFDFNETGFASLITSQSFAYFLKERFWVEHNIKFPQIGIIGESGSGKSATIENIILPILNCSSESQVSAGGITKFTFLKKMNSSNTIPVFLNEYKPEELSLYIKKLINDAENNSYDRHQGERGLPSQKHNVYENRASILMAGEAYDADQSKTERNIFIYPSLEESLDKSEQFYLIQDNLNILNKMGKTVLLKVLALETGIIKKWFLKNQELIKISTDIKSIRCIQNLAVTLCGIDILNETLNLYSVEEINKYKLSAINRYYNDTLNGCAYSKSAVETILEEINQLAIGGELIENIHYKINERADELALYIPPIFKALQINYKQRNLTLSVDQKSFTSQLRKKNELYKGYKKVRLKENVLHNSVTVSKKCFILKLSKLEEIQTSKNLDISKFVLDTEEEYMQTENEGKQLESKNFHYDNMNDIELQEQLKKIQEQIKYRNTKENI